LEGAGALPEGWLVRRRRAGALEDTHLPEGWIFK